ncbi:hypothetical protein P280DRAFT_308473 [Massarina eburnea CBS 473.64]|uniref:Uncharacterized protein n=1 Tax=Massarina eburnea CBS 473.64 TaxID=1395130 RepID=A0A6A6S4H2_9PLEO|nr:hypothetical protein P280DRAFT_308473 [Massarina eburnea CBS 473.64]
MALVIVIVMTISSRHRAGFLARPDMPFDLCSCMSGRPKISYPYIMLPARVFKSG